MSDASILDRAPPADRGALGDRVAPRRRDAAATRASILEAAMGQFAALGYDRAALRDIAAEAGADVSLIKRYFGGKEALFTEALKASIRADALSDWNRATFPRDVALMMAGVPLNDDGKSHSFQFLLRAATSPTTAPLLNVAVQERFLAPIGAWLGGEDAQGRARALAAAFIGCLVERLIRGEPLQGREREVFMARVTAMFETLTEDLSAG
ncbi:MAG TPA: TetR family transcriptional regulator [Caulobacteraceae bacterium]|jgi:AcrR family transcriptional regulator|nr:TetR family transcriptional regulator [Caulobacteraceae bacterium]